MSVESADRRAVLTILSLLSTSQRARFTELQQELQMPNAVLRPCLTGLETAGYVTLEYLTKACKSLASVKITPLGQAYFVERVVHLGMLVELIEIEHGA